MIFIAVAPRGHLLPRCRLIVLKGEVEAEVWGVDSITLISFCNLRIFLQLSAIRSVGNTSEDLGDVKGPDKMVHNAVASRLRFAH